MNILLIEDNESIIKGLKYNFLKNNYSFNNVTNLKDATDYINNNDINIIILDITLPDGDGVTFYKNNIMDKNIPTIFLTAKDDENIIVDCLNNGAEDYITKPFSTNELMARVNRILIRNKKSSIIKAKDISFALDKYEVYKNNEKINLSSLELALLNLLFTNINKVVTRTTILDKIWELTGNDVDDHTVTVYFKRIREKLGTDIIITIKGTGYRIDE